MNGKYGNILEHLRTSYWLVPGLMTLGAIVLALFLVQIEGVTDGTNGLFETFLYSGGADGAREVLSTIAGAMITVAGVVFSITIVAFTLASQQFGPRILRNLMRDRGNQVVLGTFIATFIYCLLVLRSISSDDNGREFVPAIAVAVAFVLVLFSVAVLIYFIHHACMSIRASSIIEEAGEELDDAVEKLFPSQMANPPPEYADESEPQGEVIQIEATGSGYIQVIDGDELLKLAVKQNIVIGISSTPGEFIAKGNVLAKVWQASPDQLAKLNRKINDCVVLGSERTPTQDIGSIVDQLAEVAVRALSTGINDPLTAVACVHRLSISMCDLAERPVPAAQRYDQRQQRRLILHSACFGDLISSAFDQIRPYANSSPLVSIAMMEAIARIAPHVRRDPDRAVLFRQAVMIKNAALAEVTEPWDKERLREKFDHVFSNL